MCWWGGGNVFNCFWKAQIVNVSPNSTEKLFHKKEAAPMNVTLEQISDISRIFNKMCPESMMQNGPLSCNLVKALRLDSLQSHNHVTEDDFVLDTAS